MNKTDCLLCGAPLEPLDDQQQAHPEVDDCLVRFTDSWGVAVTEEPLARGSDKVIPSMSLDITFFPFVDGVLEEIFDNAGLPRLGGMSSGRGWSSFSTYQRCPYSWKLKYLDKMRPALLVESPSLAIGSLIHTFLAVHYIRMMDESYPLTPEQVYKAARLKANPQFVEEGWRVFVGYRLFYLHEEVQPLAIEHDLRDPRTGESCRYDMVAFYPTSIAGRPAGTYIVEHKCLEANEKIQDYATGKLHTISELHAKKIAPLVLAYDEKTRRTVKAQAEVPRPTTMRDVYDVLLASGQRLRTSENHPFLTARGWVPAAELTDDDWVALASSTAGFDGISNGGRSEFTDAQVEFVGLMIGDGCMTNGTFTKTEPKVMTRFVEASAAIGEQPMSIRYDAHAPSARISMAASGPGRLLLERLGLWGHLAATKFIPDELLAIPDRQIPVLLGALWNTDGCVDVFEERSKLRPDDPQLKVRIAYVSRSKALCLGVQALLQRAGLPSSVTESSVEYKGERRDVWTTKVNTREGKRRFLDGRIPFVRYAVTEALAAIKPGDDAQIPTAYVINNVPDNELTGILRSQLKTNRTITRDALSLQGEKKASVGIQWALGAELAWSRVASVVVSGRSMMYDLTVPGPHTFVANGIITHNSASRFDNDTLEGWVNDGEVIGEVALWQKLGLDHRFGKLQGVVVNLLGKQKEPQYHRCWVAPQSWQVDGHLDDLRRYEGLIQLSRSSGNFPRARQGCIGRYGRCNYFDHCAGAEG